MSAGAPILDTLETYLGQGSSIEATARALFVHPNTVRYRLKRVAEVTGLSPSNARSLLRALRSRRLAAADAHRATLCRFPTNTPPADFVRCGCVLRPAVRES